MRLRLGVVGLLSVVLFGGTARALTPVIIENADGKEVLQMDDPTRDSPFQEVRVGGKTVCWVHGDEILTDIHAAAVLVVEDNRTVRPGPAGLILAHFDGRDLRHADFTDGKVLINYAHPDLCPTSADNRIYRVNGPELNHAQLVAVLWALKPELFKLSDAETAGQQKERADAGAQADREAAADQVAKAWTILNGHGPVPHINAGTITFGPKAGGAYPVTFDYGKDGGATFTGAAVAKQISGDWTIFTAYGTPKTIALCVYKIDGGKLTGEWHPWYGSGDPKAIGTESLTGPESLDGDFQITAAKAPVTGATYAGTVTIKPMEVVGAGDDEKPYALTWTIGGAKIQGIGIRCKDFLYVATGTGADVNIAKFTIGNGSFNGDFFHLGSNEMGGTAAMN